MYPSIPKVRVRVQQEIRIRVRFQRFDELKEGDLFICISEINRERPPATIYRKIKPTEAGLNVQVENWEGEACNGGRFHIKDYEKLIQIT